MISEPPPCLRLQILASRLIATIAPAARAVVTLGHRDIYLGKYGSSASRAKYNQLISEWLAAGRQLPELSGEISIAEIVVAHRRHAVTYYRLPNGRISLEVENFDHAVRPLLALYKRLPAVEFSPLKLKAVQADMVRLGWCRSNINRQTSRIKAIFKWAVENELIPAEVHHGLQAVSGLRRGRSAAVESEPVKPVALSIVQAVLPHVSDQVAAMMRLQLVSGMRPGEVCIMRASDLDTTGALWVYRPEQHKTQHHGHKREVYLGPPGAGDQSLRLTKCGRRRRRGTRHPMAASSAAQFQIRAGLTNGQRSEP